MAAHPFRPWCPYCQLTNGETQTTEKLTVSRPATSTPGSLLGSAWGRFRIFLFRMFRGLPALPDLLFPRGVSVPQLGGWIYRLGDSSRRKMASQFPAPQTDAGWRKPAELPLLDHERAKHYGPPTFAHVKMHPTKKGL